MQTGVGRDLTCLNDLRLWYSVRPGAEEARACLICLLRETHEKSLQAQRNTTSSDIEAEHIPDKFHMPDIHAWCSSVQALADHKVLLEGTLLKPNMVSAGQPLRQMTCFHNLER